MPDIGAASIGKNFLADVAVTRPKPELKGATARETCGRIGAPSPLVLCLLLASSPKVDIAVLALSSVVWGGTHVKVEHLGCGWIAPALNAAIRPDVRGPLFPDKPACIAPRAAGPPSLIPGERRSNGWIGHAP